MVDNKDHVFRCAVYIQELFGESAFNNIVYKEEAVAWEDLDHLIDQQYKEIKKFIKDHTNQKAKKQ